MILASLSRRATMGQAIKGKGVVVGKAAKTIERALSEPKSDPQKAKKLEEAVRFHRAVKIIE